MIQTKKANITKKQINFEESSKVKTILMLTFNGIIGLLLILGLVILFGFEKFAADFPKYEMFKYFTTQSNVLMGVVAFIYVVYASLIIAGVVKSIPKPLEIVKLVATTGVVLTFFVVILFLTPASSQKSLLYAHSNLVFHIFIPVFSAVTFLLFEHSNRKYKLLETLFTLIHMFAYAIFYMVVAFTHLKDGTVPQRYDWYSFISTFGLYWSPLVLIAMIGFTYLLGWLLWLGNKKINIFHINLKS